jgi:hypothetical protein
MTEDDLRRLRPSPIRRVVRRRSASKGSREMELRGIEPLTSAMPWRRSPS